MSLVPAVVLNPAYHLVTALSALLATAAGPLAAAAAIVVFTAAIRLVLLPLSYYAIRGQQAQARLAPQVAELRKRHAGQPDRLREELAELSRREGAGLSGCLALLLQLPFFAVLYRLFRSPEIDGARNALLAHHLLAAPLGAHWLSSPGPLSGQGLVFAVLFALLAATGWVSARVAARASAQAASSAAPPAVPGPAWLLRLSPYVTVVLAAFVPLAACLYLLTSGAWTAAERFLLGRHLSSRPR